MRSIKTRLHPERFQGKYAKAPYFEGWYFKLISADERIRYAVIPGVSLGSETEPAHSFVQVLDGISGETAYVQYPMDAFQAAGDRFDIRIGPNHFTRTLLALDLPEGPLSLKGELAFSDLHPWPSTVLSPGIMGWYSWVPKMECYHGVVSMDHGIHGRLQSDAGQLDFTGGRGYIEKDWGQAFPAAWVWMQSNHFDVAGTSLTASIADIPWMGRAFRGMIVGLLHQGTLYRFATYTGAETTLLRIEGNHVEWHMQDRNYTLTVLAEHGKAGDLRGPSLIDMSRRVPETLQATITLHLKERRSGQTLFQGTGRCGGLEIGGAINTLLSHKG